MKLMCQMNGPMGVGFSMPSRSAVEHDALAAHALLQAMEEWRALPAHNHAAQWSVEWIHGRANGLMREWTKQDEVK